jgi:hypothetical protein
MNLKPLLRGCAALSLWAGASICTYAAPITFYLNDNGQITESTSGVGNHITYTDLGSGFSITATAWYAPDANGALTAAKLSRYSGGLGVCSSGDTCSSPNHAVDNNRGKDFVLLSFNALADPYRLKLGWSYSDADVQYWVGSIIEPALEGVLIGDLATQGFSSSTVSEGDNARWIDLTAGQGMALLISGQLDEYNDYFKLEKLKVDYCPPDEEGQVPEPATLSLVGGALIGLVVYRRKRSA